MRKFKIYALIMLSYSAALRSGNDSRVWRAIFLKTTLRLIIALLFMGWLSACANKNKIYEGFCHGMYDSSSQFQKTINTGAVPPPGKEPLTYETYKRDRQEMLNGRERSPSQQ